MIIIDRAKLKFLRAGRHITIPNINANRYRTGRTYALGTNHKTTICRVEIIEKPNPETIIVKLASVNPPHLLAARSQYGYTDNPIRAMRHEPEAISREDAERLAGQARARQTVAQEAEIAQKQMRSAGIQIKAAANRGDIDAARAIMQAHLGGTAA